MTIETISTYKARGIYESLWHKMAMLLPNNLGCCTIHTLQLRREPLRARAALLDAERRMLPAEVSELERRAISLRSLEKSHTRLVARCLSLDLKNHLRQTIIRRALSGVLSFASRASGLRSSMRRQYRLNLQEKVVKRQTLYLHVCSDIPVCHWSQARNFISIHQGRQLAKMEAFRQDHLI